MSIEVAELLRVKTVLAGRVPVYYKLKYKELSRGEKEALWDIMCVLIEAGAEKDVDLPCFARELREALRDGFRKVVRLCRA